MPWVRAMFKGQRVYARATESGALDAKGGRVEIRYKPGDGRSYQASAKNLSDVEPGILAEDAVGAAVATRPDPAPRTRGEGKSAKVGPPIHLPSGKTTPVYTDGACTG